MNNDDLIITINNETLTIDSHTLEVYNVGDISVNSGDIYVYNGSSWNTTSLTVDTIDLNNIIINPIEFEDAMPDIAKVEDMCNEYPALAKAYENFKNIYAMVHQDWVGKNKDDIDPPF
jgi:hypothetical protein